MLYTIPDYYKNFVCTADKCKDTCCAGWQIVVDSKSLSKYKKICGNLLLPSNKDKKLKPQDPKFGWNTSGFSEVKEIRIFKN